MAQVVGPRSRSGVRPQPGCGCHRSFWLEPDQLRARGQDAVKTRQFANVGKVNLNLLDPLAQSRAATGYQDHRPAPTKGRSVGSVGYFNTVHPGWHLFRALAGAIGQTVGGVFGPGRYRAAGAQYRVRPSARPSNSRWPWSVGWGWRGCRSSHQSSTQANSAIEEESTRTSCARSAGKALAAC